MNMPRLAIEARIKAESLEESGKKEAIERKAKEIFMESVHALSELIAEQLYARYQYQRTALARQFPFMMGMMCGKAEENFRPTTRWGMYCVKAH